MAASVGTGIASPAAQLVNTLSAIAQKYIAPVVADQIFKPSATLWAMTRNGREITGGEIVYGVINQEETTGGAFWGDQLLDTVVVDSIQPANQIWRSYYQSFSIPINDLILSKGRSEVDLLKAKFQVASGSFLEKLSRALYDVSPQNTAIDIDSLVDWVKSTTNTVAGINRSADTFWKPAANVSNGGAPLSVANAEKAYQSVIYGYDEPDLLVMDNTAFGGFKGNFTQTIRFIPNEDGQAQDKEALQVGFRYHFMFNNCLVLQDRQCPANEAYMLNTKYIYPVFHEADYFTVDPFIVPSNQRVAVSKLFLTWQLKCSSPRMQVCITGV